MEDLEDLYNYRNRLDFNSGVLCHLAFNTKNKKEKKLLLKEIRRLKRKLVEVEDQINQKRKEIGQNDNRASKIKRWFYRCIQTLQENFKRKDT